MNMAAISTNTNVSEESRELPQPVVKWVGGKRQLLSELFTLLPADFGTYHEPFVGGGAMFFALWRAGRIREGSTIGDVNEELVLLYSFLASGQTEALVTAMKKSSYRYDRDVYYAHRADDPKKLSTVARVARFLYLNRTCFNGLYRVNKEGKFNVPFGSYKNPKIVDEDNLRAVSHALANVKIFHGDFMYCVGRASFRRSKKGDLVYFDPPYVPVSKTSDFTSYAQEGFNERDQERLARLFRDLSEDGVLCMLSNSDTPLVRELYAGFDIQTVSARRNVNSKADKRGTVNEVVVRSWIRS